MPAILKLAVFETRSSDKNDSRREIPENYLDAFCSQGKALDILNHCQSSGSQDMSLTPAVGDLSKR